MVRTSWLWPLHIEWICESIRAKDFNAFVYFWEEYKKIVDNGGFAAQDQTMLTTVDSGFNDSHQFGFPTRKAGFSRGGKEGNNAFANDDEYVDLISFN